MVERVLRARLQQIDIKGKSKKTSLLCLLLGQSWSCLQTLMGFPGDSVVKNPPATAEDAGLFPELGRFPREENGNPIQYCCLGNPMGRGDWETTVHGV